jgi:Piwi domain
MNGTFYDEPELEFRNGMHIDIRFGISHLEPLDRGSALAPDRIRLGIIGNQESVDQFSAWVEKCRKGISPKASPLVTMFPGFPGFGENGPLCDFVVNDQLTRTISSRDLVALSIIGDRNDLVEQSVGRFLGEAEDLFQSTTADIVVCLPSPELLKPIDSGVETRKGPRSKKRDRPKESKLGWHDFLKAKAMQLRGPVQMVRPATYGGKVQRYRQDGTASKDVEDEATRAWNFFTALYYKAGGVPWRLPRNASDLDTCYVGISFYHDYADDSLQTSVAQVFNERGEGVVVRGGQAVVQKDDKTVHMDEGTASSLLLNALSLYRREHKNLPARVVCHKSSYFDQGEIDGFEKAISTLGIEQLDLLSIRRSSVRFFRNKPNPPLRGTAVFLDEKIAILYTQGSVDFYRSYPGQYVPRPIEIHFDKIERRPDRLLAEVLGLTKMNWNSTRFVNAEPITLAAARSVGDVLRYVKTSHGIQSRYSYYM